MQMLQERAERLGLHIGTGRTAEVYTWDATHVLKLFRPEIPLAWVHHEATVARVVTEAGLPAPTPGNVLIDIDGRLGIIYTRVVGPTMLTSMQEQPETLTTLAQQFGELHAQMHDCVGSSLPAQHIALARSIDHAPHLSSAEKQQLVRRLKQLPTGAALCHGDFHPENVVLTAHGPMIIDWMTACCGNPLADVARTVLIFRVAQPPAGVDAPLDLFEQMKEGFLATYLDTYRTRRPFSPTEIDPWLPVLAAARLREQITGEEEPLLRLVHSAL